MSHKYSSGNVYITNSVTYTQSMNIIKIIFYNDAVTSWLGSMLSKAETVESSNG